MKKVFAYLFPARFSTFRKNWAGALHSTSYKRQMGFTIVVAFLITAFIPQFFDYIQAKPGNRLNDIVLNELHARNMSVYIFLLIYSVALLTVINLAPSPILVLKWGQAYCLLILARMVCLYLVALEPEPSIIPLQDPFVGNLFYKGSVITKDLFFSGHVSTMTLFTLAMPYRPLKYYFIVATLLVAAFILVQHVHYTVDIIVAPLFAWFCYSLVSKYRVL